MRCRGGGRSFLLLAAVVLGFNLCSSVQPSEALIYQPVLQPTEVTPSIETYTVKTLAGKPCVKVTVGVEYIVITKQKKRNSYFNLDPGRVSTSGYCGNDTAILSLTLPSNAGSLNFTFTKEGSISYVSRLSAHISPLPPCQECASQVYSGVLSHNKLFKATIGRSFSCYSESQFVMEDELRVKLVPLKVQAFIDHEGTYGVEEECLADYNKRVVPVIMGAAAVGLLLIVMLTFLFIKDHRREGYETLRSHDGDLIQQYSPTTTTTLL
ncbi:lysosome-associated membrane glycoprotein 3 [Genypterus blacodes]|uniref:lysosome-associated membrane glycoprotein 3 n=1 Tax=Genypterus blacodes TaxID=154954 RepID=UPI003F77588B